MSSRCRSVLGPLRDPRLEPSAVGEVPEQGEIGVCLFSEDRLEVELQIGVAGERGVVAQQTQRPAVADDAPQPVRGAIQELLEQAVRRLPGGAHHPAAAAVERHVSANQMERDRVDARG